jgi:hypothetical protein
MKSIIINHSFFPADAILFIIDDEMVFLYPHEGGNFQVWFTTRSFKYYNNEVNIFLHECCNGKHSADGASMCGTFQECLKSIVSHGKNDVRELTLQEREQMACDWFLTAQLNGKTEKSLIHVATELNFTMHEMSKFSSLLDASRAFAAAIKDEIGNKYMKELATKNAIDGINADFCYSHDYCDPNQIMIDVLEERGTPYGSHGFDDLCTKVWNLTKRNNFYVKFKTVR